MATSPATLLIVDDEETIHRALKRTLRREPYELLHAYDAAEAWAVLKGRPDVMGILCDHYMPGTRGLDLLLDIRCRHPELVTILLTAQADLQLVMSAINDGHIHRFFTKPWNSKELRAQLRGLLLDGEVETVSHEAAARTEKQMMQELLPEQDPETGAFIIENPNLS